MWHLGTGFSGGFASAGLALALDKLRHLSQAKSFYDFMKKEGNRLFDTGLNY